ADDEQTDVLIRIVDEGVADPGTGREADAVPGYQPEEMAVDPGVRVAFDDVDELLFRALGMRVGSPPARSQELMMDAEPREAKDAAEWRAYAEQFVAAGVMGVVGLLNLAVVLDERRTLSSLAHGASSFRSVANLAPPSDGSRCGRSFPGRFELV